MPSHSAVCPDLPRRTVCGRAGTTGQRVTAGWLSADPADEAGGVAAEESCDRVPTQAAQAAHTVPVSSPPPGRLASSPAGTASPARWSCWTRAPKPPRTSTTVACQTWSGSCRRTAEALRTRRPAWLRAGQSGRVRAGGSGTAPAAWSGVRTCGWPQRCGMSGCGDPGQALARTPLSRSCLPRRAGGRRAVARSHPRQPRRLRRSTSKSILETQPRSGLIDGSGGAKADAGMRRTWTRTALVAATGRRTGT